MGKNVRIVPAILTDDPAALAEMIKVTQKFTNFAQVDIMDGRFVPSQSVTCEDVAALDIKMDWEAHLMVREPETCLDDFRRAGAGRIVFHYEATDDPKKVISMIKKLGMTAGLAVNPETPVDAFAPLVADIDSVLFLSVNPGYYGAPFIPQVLDKIKEFVRRYPETEIGIDGGIKESNIGEIAGYGVDFICVGSAIYRQDDPGASFRRLQEMAAAGA